MIINLQKGTDYHEVGRSRMPSLFVRKQKHQKPFGKRAYDPYARVANKPRLYSCPEIMPREPYLRAWVWVALGLCLPLLWANWGPSEAELAKRHELERQAGIGRIVEASKRIEECRIRTNQTHIAPWNTNYKDC